MTSADLGFIHRFVPGTDEGAPTFLLLHGTGGSEDDLLPLGRQLMPGAALLGVRGQVLERGRPRFFRRLAEGVFDLDDLQTRTQALADFVRSAAEAYGFSRGGVVAVGYSNGANIAASALLLRPDAFRRAVLWRAQVPIEPAIGPALDGHEVIITAGRHDPLVPARESERLCEVLTRYGAMTELAWIETGHALAREDLETARRWLLERVSRAEG